jgi:hypothetical protein
VSVTTKAVYFIRLGLGLWCLTPLSTIFQLYRGRRNRSTRRKPQTCRKSLTHFITCCIEYTSPWTGFELTTLVVIDTNCTGSSDTSSSQRFTLASSFSNSINSSTSDTSSSQRFLSTHLLWGVAVIVWWLDLQLPMQSVHITTEVVSSNPVHDEVYWIQHCDKVLPYQLLKLSLITTSCYV